MTNKVAKKLKTTEKLSYVGEVTVKLCDDKRVLFTKKFNNDGTKYLSKFLCLCLSGGYASAEAYRPFKVKLFSNNSDAAEAQNNLQNSVPCMGSFISMNKLPIISEEMKADDPNTIVGYSATLHFIVPYTYIQIPSGAENGINQICLYSVGTENIASNNNTYLASVLLREAAEGTGIIEWKPITVPQTSLNNYNLIIDWAMKFELDKAAEEDYDRGFDEIN